MRLRKRYTAALALVGLLCGIGPVPAFGEDLAWFSLEGEPGGVVSINVGGPGAALEIEMFPGTVQIGFNFRFNGFCPAMAMPFGRVVWSSPQPCAFAGQTEAVMDREWARAYAEQL